MESGPRIHSTNSRYRIADDPVAVRPRVSGEVLGAARRRWCGAINLVLGRFFRVVDNQDFHCSFGRFHFETSLFP